MVASKDLKTALVPLRVLVPKLYPRALMCPKTPIVIKHGSEAGLNIRFY
jgi:hypothetical protein